MAEDKGSRPQPRGGLALYANLLDPGSAPGTISSAPVHYKQPDGQDDAAKKQLNSGWSQ